MRLLYLTFFESPSGNGIYETQVRQVLCALGSRYPAELTIDHLALLPAVVFGKRGISKESVFYARFAELRSLYLENGVRARVAFLPLIIPKREKSGLRLPVLAVALSMSLPILIFEVLRCRADIVHCRSYVAATIALAGRLVRKDLKVIFDPRGFYPEEGILTQRWDEGSVTFKVWKRIERYLCRHSDAVVALSEPFAERVRTLSERSIVTLIPAATRVDGFRQSDFPREAVRDRLQLAGRTVFAYCGALGSWHDPALLGRLFAVIRGAVGNAHLLVLTSFNRERLARILKDQGVSEQDCSICCVEQAEVTRYLLASDFGLVPSTSSAEGAAYRVVADTMIGTKVAEYFAAGLPIIANENLGGLRSLMRGRKLRVAFKSHDLTGLTGELLRMIAARSEFSSECLRIAHECFSVERVAESYLQLYRSVHSDSHNVGEEAPC